MIFLHIFAVLSVLGLMYMRYEASLIKVDHVKFTKSKNCLKILQLSDLHVNRLKVPLVKILNIIRKEMPDLIIITGDFLERKSHLPKLLPFLDEIKDIQNIYACLGNHDYEAFGKDSEGLNNYLHTLQNAGLNLLQNKSVVFQKGARKYNVIGVADMRYGHDDIKKALENCSPDAAASIAFTHNPDLVLKFPKCKVDYLFSGHFHGGQIWMPFGLEFKLLRNEKLCKRGITRGLHKVNGINLYINRGLGNVVFPFRFLSRPEITVFHLP